MGVIVRQDMCEKVEEVRRVSGRLISIVLVFEE